MSGVMMKGRPWESDLLDWSAAGYKGAVVSPERVLELMQATTEELATKAYWRLDGVVCLTEVTYPAALPTTQMILSQLPSAHFQARRRGLELLGQIVGGQPEDGARDVVRDCLEELRQLSWYFLHGLQYDDVELSWLYVDLVGVLAVSFPDLRRRALAYLGLALTRPLPNHVTALVKENIAALG